VDKVTAAADMVLAAGYILEEDRNRYVAEAAFTIPHQPEKKKDDGGGDDVPTCTGHGDCETAIDLPEGGEIRLELVDQQDRFVEVRTHAWFASDQVPALRPFTRPSADWDVQDGANMCVRTTSASFFPGGPPESRTYIDAGSSVTLSPGGDGPDLVLAKAENVQDWSHHNFHDILYISDINADDIERNAEYDFVGAGRSEANALRVPGDYELSFPDMTEQVEIPSGTDFPFYWEPPGKVRQFDYALVSFADAYGPTHVCIGPPSGVMTIPAATISDLNPAGKVDHCLLNHRVIEVDGRRWDFIGANCKEANYNLLNTP